MAWGEELGFSGQGSGKKAAGRSSEVLEAAEADLNFEPRFTCCRKGGKLEELGCVI